jgi:hypothetical protein
VLYLPLRALFLPLGAFICHLGLLFLPLGAFIFATWGFYLPLGAFICHLGLLFLPLGAFICHLGLLFATWDFYLPLGTFSKVNKPSVSFSLSLSFFLHGCKMEADITVHKNEYNPKHCIHIAFYNTVRQDLCHLPTFSFHRQNCIKLFVYRH